MIDRRVLCVAAAGSLFGAGAQAAPDAPLFASGALATNSLARGFRAPPRSLAVPDTALTGGEGAQTLRDLRGRTYLVSLWAEWCAPCLMEAGDLASLAETYGGPSFAVVFVLTGSGKKLDFPAARAVLAKYGAGGARLLVEPDGGDAVMRALATTEYSAALRAVTKRDRGASLPCNLLIDRRGRVRGRSFGASSTTTDDKPHEGVMNEADKARLLTQHSLWATAAGREFVAALAAGALEKS